MKCICTIFALVIMCMPMYAGKRHTVSVKSLLEEMVDRDVKARYPDPYFTCAQFSSYDRASVSKDRPGWFGNWDRTQFYGIDTHNGRTEYVMADAKGPGAIVRFWMTFAGPDCGQGILRIYVDDMEVPAVEGKPMEILSGDKVTAYPLAASVSELSPYEQRGHNLYFPIPYSERCRITYEHETLSADNFGARDGSEAVYYNINYRTYEPGTHVIPYSEEQVAENKELIDKVNSLLKNRPSNPAPERKSGRVDISTELSPDENRTFTITGSRAVRCLSMKIDAPEIEQALRSVVLDISFDGNRTVWAPVGDFFGTGPRRLVTDTWYTSVSADGHMSAFWIMPFQEKCEMTLHNFGDQKVTVSDAAVIYSPWKWDRRSMYFGASWHQYSDIFTPESENNETDAVDLNFVTLHGKGVYIGDGVSLFNHSDAWWGEGDEKIYVDGEVFPSHFGTGTEDYYGYAWCLPAVFTGHPFVAQPSGKGNFAPDFTVNTRYRSLDIIPFSESLQFDMELWHWSSGYMDYAPVTFYYMLPGGKSDIEPDIEEVMKKVKL